MIKFPHNLTEEEFINLGTLIQSPGFKILEKIAKFERDQIANQILSLDDEKQIWRLQGRAVGVLSFVSVPKAYAAAFQQNKKEKEKKPQMSPT